MKSRTIAGCVFTFTLVLAIPAHAKERSFQPYASAGQEVRYSDGEAVVYSATDRHVVGLSYIPRDKKSGFIKLWVLNRGSTAFNIGDQSITASSGGIPLQVLSYQDRLKEQRRQEMWQGLAAGLAAAGNNMQAANAGYSNSYGTYNSTTRANVYGSNGYATGNAYTTGTYSGSTYNAGAAYAAQADANARNQQIFAQAAANSEYARRELADRALKMNTLSPGQDVIGDVRLALPKRTKTPGEFTVTVDVNGEAMSFNFREH
jgi:hypothetical protein